MRCPATIGSLEKSNQMVTQNKEIKIYNIPNESLERMIDQYDKIKAFGGALKQELFLRLNKGEESSSYELGAGRRKRIWRNEPAAFERLKEICKEQGISPTELYDSKLISVAKAEKLLAKSKKDVAELVAFVDGKGLSQKVLVAGILKYFSGPRASGLRQRRLPKKGLREHQENHR